jgi:leucyl-tRNA synthetase
VLSKLRSLAGQRILGEDDFSVAVKKAIGTARFDELKTKIMDRAKANIEYHDWLFPEEVTEDKRCKFCGNPVEVGRVEKMSKSRKNAVDPIEMIKIHGADALRVFVLFAGPPEKDKEWSDAGFEGASRYLQRVWRIAYKWHPRIKDASAAGFPAMSEMADYQRRLRRRAHQIIRSITENFEERLHLNTCISSLMELTNELYLFDQAVDKNDSATDTDAKVARFAFEALIRMLAPFAPHMAEELWETIGHTESISRAEWPAFSDELARDEEIEIAVQVNGKLRSRIFAAPDASEDHLRESALKDEKVQAAAAGHDIAKVIVVPRKLVNVVIK